MPSTLYMNHIVPIVNLRSISGHATNSDIFRTEIFLPSRTSDGLGQIFLKLASLVSITHAFGGDRHRQNRAISRDPGIIESDGATSPDIRHGARPEARPVGHSALCRCIDGHGQTRHIASDTTESASRIQENDAIGWRSQQVIRFISYAYCCHENFL